MSVPRASRPFTAPRRWSAACLRGLVLAAALLVVGGACGGGDGGGVVAETVTPIAVESPPPRADVATAPATIEPPELLLSIEEAQQGSAILVSVTGSVGEGEVEFLGRRYPLTQGDFSKYAYVAVGIPDAPGAHTLRVRFTLTNGSAGSFEREITVGETQWDFSNISYKEAPGAPALDDEERAREDALLAETYATFTPGKLWAGRWRIPTEGPISSHFGERRSFNDGPVSANHGGTDFAAPEGTPVTAANSGRVALAQQLAIRGNMVIIDHGGGVFSGYAHLSAFAVAEGQTVEKGQLIAFVGNSGLSTAPHLHWEITVHGVFVDPMRFVDFRNGF